MNTLRYLPNAQGAQLDVIGIIVGEPRPPGTSDADYINLIYGRIKINTSQGQPEYAIQTFQLFTGAPQVILYEGRGCVLLESIWVPPNQAAVDSLINILLEVLPAGVRADGIVAYDPTDAFAYAGTLPGQGYGTVSDPSVGGKYPTLYQFHGGGFAYAGDDVAGLGYGSIHDPLVGGIYLT